MLGSGVLSLSRPYPVLPVLVGSRLIWSRVSLSFWQGGVQQLENSLSCLSFVLKGSLKTFPFLECLWSPHDSKGLPRAVPGLSRVMPAGCANGHHTHGSTHKMWHWLLSAPSLFPLLLSWLLAEN